MVVAMPKDVVERLAGMKTSARLLVVVPNAGLASVLCRYLDRWGPDYACGPTLDAAMAVAHARDAVDAARGLAPKAVTVVVADIDRGGALPPWLVAHTGVRFLLLCTGDNGIVASTNLIQLFFQS